MYIYILINTQQDLLEWLVDYGLTIPAMTVA